MNSSSFRFGFSYWCWFLRGHSQPPAATAALQRNSLVNDHSTMNCWWLSSLVLLPICCLALEISYGDGQPAECRRDRVAARLFQCSGPNGKNILLNCLGDRIKTMKFFIKEGEQVLPKIQKPGDVHISKFIRNENVSLEEWNENVATSNWEFIWQHSLLERGLVSYDGNELNISSQSPDDVFNIEISSFEPLGFLVETFQPPTEEHCDESASCCSLNYPQSQGSYAYLMAHPAWSALGTFFTAIFSMVAVSTLRRCRQLNRREARRSSLDPMVMA